MPNIVIVNASKVLKDAAVAAYIPFMQSFDDERLRPAWGLDPCVYTFQPWGKIPKPTADLWPIFLNNKSDTPGALGWHDDQAGLIFGRCFVGDCKRYGVSPWVDMTHEAWEMRVDPTINRLAPLANGVQAMVEVGDPVEDDLFAIPWKGVKVSNAVLPSFFGLNGWAGPWDIGTASCGMNIPLRGNVQDIANHTVPIPSGGYQTLLIDGQYTQLTARLADGTLPYRATRMGRVYHAAGGMR